VPKLPRVHNYIPTGKSKARDTPSKGTKPDKLMRDALSLSLHRAAIGADGKATRRLNVVAEKVVDMAIDGNMDAAKLIFERMDGKVIQQIEGDITVDHLHAWLIGARRLDSGPALIEGELKERDDYDS
jgi:hypothetical protein